MKGIFTYGALGVGLVLFIAINVLSSATLRSQRIDLTADKLYTLSDGSKNIVRNLNDKVYLDFFYSKKQADQVPTIKGYATRVSELLEEYALLSGGKVQLNVLNPEPFSDAEDQAVQAGLRGVPISAAGELLYLGLVGRNTLDGEEIVPFFDPNSERFLEYELTKLVYTLSSPDKKTVGLMSSLPLEGGAPNPMNPMAQPTPPWQIVPQLETYFDVERIETTATEIPEGVDVLMLAHAKGLSDETLYAIDQFVLAGGRVVAFVDPVCEADMPPVDPNNPMAAMQADKSSNLDKLFTAWGVRMLDSKIAGDRERALQVQTREGRPVPFVIWLGLGAEQFAEDDPVISELATINTAAAGILEPIEGATTEFAPLIRTTDDSMKIEQSRVQFFPQPEDLLTTFIPSGEPLTLAARVSGTVNSAFPEGSPSGAEAAEDGDAEGHLNQSVGPINVVLVADADLLQDRFWIRAMNLGPISLGHQKTADNGDFVFNTIENLCGNNDLISVRAGSNFARPFTRVEELQRQAQEKYLLESKVLEQKLQATEAKLADLQRQKGDSDQMILSAEQRAELDRFNEEKLETRKQLRAVQHNLNKDIEGLGTTLKLANILGTPLLFTLIVLGVWRTRSRRKQ